MSIGYSVPLGRAWERMTLLLFKPFRPGVWLVLGFAAFLGAQRGAGLGFRGNPWVRDRVGDRWHDGAALDWLGEALHEPFWLVVLVTGGVVLLAVGLVLTWVFSRGAFVFLDDVLTARVRIVDPWKRFARQGDSLFLWRLLLAFLAVLVLGVVLLCWIPMLLALRRGESPGPDAWGPGIVGTVVAVPIFLALAVVQILLHQFVVPLMWAHGLRANDAWRRFLPVLRDHLGAFVVYVLLLIGLAIAALAAILVFGAATCCCGLCLLAVPYVGSVITLPITVTLRALGPEFLAQIEGLMPPLPPPSRAIEGPEALPAP
jgi:hypothetical protein